MLKRRRAVRKRSFIPATLATTDVEVACTILDISESGARLRLPPGYFLSSSCYVRAPELGKAVRSRIVWRQKGELGLTFS